MWVLPYPILGHQMLWGKMSFVGRVRKSIGYPSSYVTRSLLTAFSYLANVLLSRCSKNIFKTLIESTWKQKKKMACRAIIIFLWLLSVYRVIVGSMFCSLSKYHSWSVSLVFTFKTANSLKMSSFYLIILKIFQLRSYTCLFEIQQSKFAMFDQLNLTILTEIAR